MRRSTILFSSLSEQHTLSQQSVDHIDLGMQLNTAIKGTLTQEINGNDMFQ
jgi:hypothetical protein